MPILQLHYTSCRAGLSGHSGFQTRAVSGGLSAEAVQQIEPLCHYVPPRGAVSNPTAEQIDRVFPVSFRRATLRDGRWLLLRTQLAGTNYDGRPGNIFSHALIGDGPPEIGFDPLRICFWPHWKKRLLPEEDLPIASPPLPLLSESDVFSRQGLPISRLQDFLQAAPERIPVACQMLRAIWRISTERRCLLIVDQPDCGLLWLSVLLTALPLPLAQTLTFNTWQSGFESLADLSLTGPGSELAEDLSDGPTDQRYQLFDFPNRRFCDPPGARGDFAETVISLIASGEDHTLRELHAFIAWFGETGFSDALNPATTLFVQQNAQQPLPAGWELSEFLVKRLQPRHLLKCTGLLKRMLEHHDWSQRPDLLEALAHLFQAGSEEDRTTGFDKAVLEFCGILWQRQFLNPPESREPIGRCLNQLQRLIAAKRTSDPGGLLSEQQLSGYLTLLFQKAPQHLNAAIADLALRTQAEDTADFTRAPWPAVRETLAKHIRGQSGEEVAIPLDWCSRRYLLLAAWIALLTEHAEPAGDELAASLAAQLDWPPRMLEPATASALLRRLDEIAASRFLKAAWCRIVKKLMHVAQPAWAESLGGFAENAPRFWRVHSQELMPALLKQLDGAGQQQLNISLLRAGLEELLPYADSAELLRSAAAAVSLDCHDQPSADLIRRLRDRGVVVEQTESARMKTWLLIERFGRAASPAETELQEMAQLLTDLSDEDFFAAAMSLFEQSLRRDETGDSTVTLYRRLAGERNCSGSVEACLLRLLSLASTRNWPAECWVNVAAFLLQPELREQAALRGGFVESLRNLPRAFWWQCSRHAEVRWSGSQHRQLLREWRNLFAKPSGPWWRRWW